MPTGRIVDGGKVRYVRSLARYEDIEELRQYPIGNGLVLSDIAEVNLRKALNPDISRIEGRDGVAFGIYKESQANSVEVTRAVEAVFAELEQDKQNARNSSPVTFFNQGDLIQDSIDNLLNTALWGGLFAVICPFLLHAPMENDPADRCMHPLHSAADGVHRLFCRPFLESAQFDGTHARGGHGGGQCHRGGREHLCQTSIRRSIPKMLHSKARPISAGHYPIHPHHHGRIPAHHLDEW